MLCRSAQRSQRSRARSRLGPPISTLPRARWGRQRRTGRVALALTLLRAQCLECVEPRVLAHERGRRSGSDVRAVMLGTRVQRGRAANGRLTAGAPSQQDRSRMAPSPAGRAPSKAADPRSAEGSGAHRRPRATEASDDNAAHDALGPTRRRGRGGTLLIRLTLYDHGLSRAQQLPHSCIQSVSTRDQFEPIPDCRCGGGEPSPGTDGTGVSPVPVQMGQG